MRKTILVVEDELELLDLIAQILRRSGYHVVAAQTTDETAHILCENEQSRVDLILSDFNLPGANGLEFVGKLRASHIPVILMAGNREACDKIVDHGYVCLRKPFSSTDMEQTVGEMLSERRPLSADA